MPEEYERARPRRLMPSVSALAAFEAVVRNGSFTAAAGELALTQSAVSRQIIALEDMLGVVLIDKERRRQVVLTASGTFFVDRVREILSQLTAATTEAIALGDRGRALRLGIPPTFGSLWLIPRMPSFFAAHPDITVEFSTRVPSQPRSGPGDLHALIDFQTSPGDDAMWEELIQLELRPVATREIAEAVAERDRARLSSIHVLVHTSERANWPHIFERLELAHLRTRPLLTFENYTMLLQAAARGLGVALAPVALMENDLSSGRLVPISDISVPSRRAGFLIYQPQMDTYPPLVAFREWLHDTIRASVRPRRDEGPEQSRSP